ncbi:N-acetylmuramyl-L-alanine amidase, negative regulator of AmpC, AmpD [Pseudanabaena sp. lw0831]|uniref:M15 family metallopeptidase n=1 Tax=Pseudanabaena sp. lw0831 TaxID=1357935 RepID=UPI00191532D1|nr:M15 family metallopeptidase [Pseudanabaena sp. lw0831]GBO56041.1 N-acetylmuramyl-L-alanine amidase, negative regulator of AmpC, AmpD [Pseudanabaena sp. lw0831]
MALPVLKRNNKGDAVFLWQNFLVGKKLLDQADGIFGQGTEDATKAYQLSQGLKDDGIVGGQTYGKALLEGLDVIEFETDFPPKPPFSALVSTGDRQSVFGKFDFEIDSRPDNREHIKILGTWVSNNIIDVDIPELKPPVSSSKMEFNEKASAQLQGLWKAWKAQDLVKFILTFDGSFVPRLIRGAPLIKDFSKLSNHAFGSAFDINAGFNPLGQTPAFISQKGSVRLLVPTANDYGFYWGGHFSGRKDGMHFEVAKILNSTELVALATKYKI